MTEDYSRRSDMLFDMNNLGYNHHNFSGNNIASNFKVPDKSPSPHHLLELTSANPVTTPLSNHQQRHNQNSAELLCCFNQTELNPSTTTCPDDSLGQIKQMLNATGSSQTSSEYMASSNSSPTQLGSSSFGNESSSIGNNSSGVNQKSQIHQTHQQINSASSTSGLLSQFWPSSSDSTLHNCENSNLDKGDLESSLAYLSNTRSSTFKHSENLALLEDTIERRIPRCSSPLKSSLGISGRSFNLIEDKLNKELDVHKSNGLHYQRSSSRPGYTNFLHHENASQLEVTSGYTQHSSATTYQRSFPNSSSDNNTNYPVSSNPSSHQRSVPAEVSRRKNATRENTATLKAWLQEHIKNPYPTKGEKIMLAIITKMTLTQVSTWFANARRRLKKENKMTWSPKVNSGTAQSVTSANDDQDEVDDDEAEDEIEEENEERSVSQDYLQHRQQQPDESQHEEPAKRLKFENHYQANRYYPCSQNSYQAFQNFSQTMSSFPSQNQGSTTWRDEQTFPSNQASYPSSFAAAMAAISNLNSYHHDGYLVNSTMSTSANPTSNNSNGPYNSAPVSDCLASAYPNLPHSQKLYENY